MQIEVNIDAKRNTYTNVECKALSIKWDAGNNLFRIFTQIEYINDRYPKKLVVKPKQSFLHT